MWRLLVLIIVLLIGIYIVDQWCSKKTVNYFTKPSELDNGFRSYVAKVLSKSGWNEKYDLHESQNINNADFTIELMRDSDMDRFKNKPSEFDKVGDEIKWSVTSQGPNIKPSVYINYKNWQGVPRSGLTLDEYRHYVIEHEVGHALGYDHQDCISETVLDGTCPVMYQSTRGCPPKFKCGYKVTPADFRDKLDFAYLK